jgi:FYVE/RhoGEF/PH domain-containing protein 5/6
MVESGGRGRGRGRRREFLLFSDCLVWLERIGPGAVELDDSVGAIGSTSAIGNGNSNAEGDTIKRPGIVRSRSKSDAELSRLRARRAVAHVSSKSPPRSPSRTNAAPAVPAKRHSVYPRVGSTSEETTERWEYKGLAWLVDVEVVVPMPLDGDSGEGDESDEVGQEQRRLDVLSPEGSFVLYAGKLPISNPSSLGLNEFDDVQGQLMTEMNGPSRSAPRNRRCSSLSMSRIPTRR